MVSIENIFDWACIFLKFHIHSCKKMFVVRTFIDSEDTYHIYQLEDPLLQDVLSLSYQIMANVCSNIYIYNSSDFHAFCSVYFGRKPAYSYNPEHKNKLLIFHSLAVFFFMCDCVLPSLLVNNQKW